MPVDLCRLGVTLGVLCRGSHFRMRSGWMVDGCRPALCGAMFALQLNALPSVLMSRG